MRKRNSSGGEEGECLLDECVAWMLDDGRGRRVGEELEGIRVEEKRSTTQIGESERCVGAK